MSKEIAIVFTAKSIERIIREGGTSAWRLDRNHARRCIYAVCTRNAHSPWVEGQEAHHAAFVVGKISDVVPCRPTPENEEAPENRFLIEFSEFARVDIPGVWAGDRNPVKYRSAEDLDIDFSTLKWEPMPEPQSALAPVVETPSAAQPKAALGPLTMADAKKGLALTFNVPPEAIEITIRG
jgi:hypothetical protein